MKMGIRARILLLTLAPATLTAMALASYLTAARLKDFKDSFQSQAHTLTRQFALACAYGVSISDRDLLNRLAESMLNETVISKVAIRDLHGNSLVNLSKLHPRAISPPASMTLSFEAPIPASQGGAVDSRLSSPIGQVTLEFLPEGSIQQQRILQTSLLLTGLCLLLSAIVGYTAYRRVCDPLLRLENAIRELRSNRRYIPSLKPSMAKSGYLDGDIDTMVAALRISHQHLQEQIEEATAELRQTLEELEIKNVQLDIARKKAIQASRVKSEFLANMSHEIRTPMNGVMGFITLLSKTKLNRTQQGYLGTLRASAENLMVILNDILDFSKIEAGKFKIRQRNFELRETLENAVLLFAANAQYKGLKLILDIEPKVPSDLVGDASRIAQIVTNFVSNSVKFTDQGEIEVTVRRISESSRDVVLNILIRDTGIGIAPADQKRLFNAFYQLDTSTTRRHSGTGLGLAICHRLVSMMDGKISVESRPGQGSVFSITLKLAKQEPLSGSSDKIPAATTGGAALVVSVDSLLSRAVTHILEFGGMQARSVESFAAAVDQLCETAVNSDPPRSMIIDDSTVDSVSEPMLKRIDRQLTEGFKLILIGINEDHDCLQYLPRFFSTIHFANKPPTSRELLTLLDTRPRSVSHEEEPDRSGAGESSPAQARAAEAKILLADDNLINRQLARIFLNQIGSQVDEAANGLEAIKACLRERYDLILMDIHMPDMDGLEVTRRIRALKNNFNSNTPIVALTADVMNQERAQYLQAGMNDYLAKPITEAALRMTLERWCHGPNELYSIPSPLLNEKLA